MKAFTVKAVDVLHNKMHTYNKEAREILSYLIEQMRAQNKNSPALKSLYQLMQKADEIVIDCAHKLAPYQDAKLNAIEIKSKISHSFVLRAPTKVKSIKEWQELTGAEVLPPNTKAEEHKLSPIEPSIHDFDEEELIEDQKRMLN